jgi:predicted NBD/HSP70 family sugar kinase/putative N-acetylmannosamine-6-phosphate epimerase
MSIPAVCQKLEGKLIASCQAPAGDTFSDPQLIARFAQAALAGGAAGIRANGPPNVSAIRRITDAPIIGIQKIVIDDGKVLITPSLETARDLVSAGADIIAIDATARGQRYEALQRIRQIKQELGVPVFADISTVDEALMAARSGADFVLSTLRGYTAETAHVSRFEPSFIEDLAPVCPVPVIAEGRIHTREDARRAMAAGAFAVVVGTAITRPAEIARLFSEAIQKQWAARSANQTVLGIDLGATNTKLGIVSAKGELLFHSTVSTPAFAGREVLLNHLKRVGRDLLDRGNKMGHAPAALGVATAGWVNTETGTVAYATENLPGWTGTRVGDELYASLGIPVAVENDANAFAIAEKHFGAGRGLRDFVCITLGTGVGGGCFVRGRLNRGAHFFANALGHISLVPGGLPCTCGNLGCLEVYCNAAALLRYAGDRFQTVEDIIAASNSGDNDARLAILTLAKYLAQGCFSLIQLLDPEALILSGGLVQNNSALIEGLKAELAQTVPAYTQRKLIVRTSPLGYYGGVLGAAAVAIEEGIDTRRATVIEMSRTLV